MACMYIRVPHYVASFWRNREERKPIPMGGRVDLSGEYELWNMLRQGLCRNPAEEVSREGCYCERMWRKMLRGQSLVPNAKGAYTKVYPGRDTSQYLTDAEVRTMSGLKEARHEDTSEYLCVELPSRVYINGTQYLVDGQWQMKGKTVQMFVAELRREFWHECLAYVEQFLESGNRKMERSTNEGLDRFMLRYDIRISQDNKERATLKRSYYRQLARKADKPCNYEEFGKV